MKRRHLAELLLLAALWGASFLFMRLGAAEFGAVPLAGLRVAGAALVVLPLLALQGQLGALRQHWKPLLLVGLTNSAFPFVCYSYAALSLNAGLSSIFNAASPLFAALIAWAWLGDRLGRWRVLGLLIGFGGVFGLAWAKAGFQTSGAGAGNLLAISACILATVSYGFSANFTKRHLSNAPPMAVACGSQLGATVLLAGPTAIAWPAVMPGAVAWASLAALAMVCTGLAYILYFRLIASIGPANAITVTFLVPAFAVAWGAAFLGEALSWQMVGGCAVILVGTALATGLVNPARAGR
jgi:drug/metabolite transporter (DMT)-like permease